MSGENVSMHVNGSILVIEVDLSQTLGPSSSGKSEIIARWERPVHLPEPQRTVRHSRSRFWPVRGMACEECGDQLPPTHPFGVYGSWCVSCWGWFQGGSAAADGGHDALVSSWQAVAEVWVDG